MLLENYDIHFGIFDHSMYKDRPFSLIELHPAERLDYVDPLYELMERFAEKDVFKHYGMSFDKFVELPRDRVEKIFEICDKLNRKEGRIASELSQNLTALSKMGK